jgi:hypothetical protein
MRRENKNKEQQEWEKNYPEGKACFSWTLADYKIWQQEPPDCLQDKSNLSEGEQLSDEELETWFVDSVKSLTILKEQDQKIFKKVCGDFTLDVEYLVLIKRLGQESLDFVSDQNNFCF